MFRGVANGHHCGISYAQCGGESNQCNHLLRRRYKYCFKRQYSRNDLQLGTFNKPSIIWRQRWEWKYLTAYPYPIWNHFYFYYLYHYPICQWLSRNANSGACYRATIACHCPSAGYTSLFHPTSGSNQFCIQCGWYQLLLDQFKYKHWFTANRKWGHSGLQYTHS